MSAQTMEMAALTENSFLAPILHRWRQAPHALAGMFHDGEAWQAVEQHQLSRHALQFAALYAGHGIQSGDIVLIILRHGEQAYAAFIGAMLIGAVPSFLPHPNVKQDAGLYWRQHRAVFAHTKPAAILVHGPFRDAVAAAVSDIAVKVIDAGSAAAQPAAWPANLPASGAVGLLQHSSGTTGLKKGVQLTYRAICLQLEAYQAALRLSETVQPRIASWLPLYHDMGLITSLLLPLWLGIPVLSIDPFEWTRRPAIWLDAIQDYQATHAWIPNFAFRHQVRSARGAKSWALGSLKAVISCSEPCKPEAFDAFAARFASCGVSPAMLQTSYAMAEAVFAVTQSPIGAPVRRLAVDRACIHELGRVRPPASDGGITLLSNGPPVAGCEVRILREDSLVGADEIGEICIAAPFMFTGYYNNPSATEAAFFGRWYRTGDLGFLNQNELFIVGRLKDVIILNGKNIFSHDVEAAVSLVPGIKPGRAVALGMYDDVVGSEQLIVVAERADATIADADLESAINRAVLNEAGVACTNVRIVEEGWLVKTTSGKMSRSENAKKYQQESASFCEQKEAKKL